MRRALRITVWSSARTIVVSDVSFPSDAASVRLTVATLPAPVSLAAVLLMPHHLTPHPVAEHRCFTANFSLRSIPFDHIGASDRIVWPNRLERGAGMAQGYDSSALDEPRLRELIEV